MNVKDSTESTMFDKFETWCNSFVITVSTFECSDCGEHFTNIDGNQCNRCSGELFHKDEAVFPNDWY